MNNKHIVFGSEHCNPLGLIRSLGENKLCPIAIILKGSKKIASKSKYISQLFMVDTIEEGFNLLIKKFGNEVDKPFLYTSDDTITAFLDNHYNDLKNKFYFYNAGNKGRLNYYMEKVNICQLAEKCGLDVAKMWVVKKGKIPNDIEYPIITKACNSKKANWKNEVHICYNDKELHDAYKKINSEKIILQKYIIKKNEIVVSGISVNKGKDVLYTMEINYNYLIEDSYSYYMTINNFNGYNMINQINKLFKEVGFEGIFEIEFLLGEDNKKYFLEINFRPSAYNYASTVAGMPLPVIWSKSMLNNEIIKNNLKKIKKFNAMSEFLDYSIRVKNKKIGFFKWLYQFFCSKCKYHFNIKDLKPFLSILGIYIKRK